MDTMGLRENSSMSTSEDRESNHYSKSFCNTYNISPNVSFTPFSLLSFCNERKGEIGPCISSLLWKIDGEVSLLLTYSRFRKCCNGQDNGINQMENPCLLKHKIIVEMVEIMGKWE